MYDDSRMAVRVRELSTNGSWTLSHRLLHYNGLPVYETVKDSPLLREGFGQLLHNISVENIASECWSF